MFMCKNMGTISSKEWWRPLKDTLGVDKKELTSFCRWTFRLKATITHLRALLSVSALWFGINCPDMDVLLETCLLNENRAPKLFCKHPLTVQSIFVLWNLLEWPRSRVPQICQCAVSIEIIALPASLICHIWQSSVLSSWRKRLSLPLINALLLLIPPQTSSRYSSKRKWGYRGMFYTSANDFFLYI